MNRLGVAVPTWNAGRTLEWTLLSLRQQVGCTVEAVVADSGSTDATLSVCAAAGVRTVFEPPGNMYRAVNAGLRALDCAWLTYLNADDMAYADAYAALIETGERTGADLVYGDCDYVDGHGRFLFSMRAAPRRLLRGMYRVGMMPFQQPCAVFRRELFDNLGGFNPQYRHIGDLDFFSRADQAGARFEQVLGLTVVAFRLHPGQFSAREHPSTREEVARYLTRLKSPVRLNDRLASWWWRLANAREYVVRRLRAGTWSDRPPQVGALGGVGAGAAREPDRFSGPAESAQDAGEPHH